MAEPGVPPSALVDACHAAVVGGARSGVRVNTRTADADNPNRRTALYQLTVTVTAGSRPFTCVYMAQADGSPGRIVEAVDAQGAAFRKGRGDVWREMTERVR